MPTTCSKRARQSVATTCPFSPTRSTSSWPIRSGWRSCRPTCNASPSRMLHKRLSIGCCCSRSADALWKTRGLCLCQVFALIRVALFDTPTPTKGGDPEGDQARQTARERAPSQLLLGFLGRMAVTPTWSVHLIVRSRVNKQGSEAVDTRKTTRKIFRFVLDSYTSYMLISAGAPISLQATGRQNVNRGPGRTRFPSENTLSEFSHIPGPFENWCDP